MTTKRVAELLETQFAYDELKDHNDVEAFVLLQSILPKRDDGVVNDLVTRAEHDQIWLRADLELLAEHATEAQILMLRRCGVWFDRNADALSMFV